MQVTNQKFDQGRALKSCCERVVQGANHQSGQSQGIHSKDDAQQAKEPRQAILGWNTVGSCQGQGSGRTTAFLRITEVSYGGDS